MTTQITQATFTDFKKLSSTEIPLSGITVLVGGNNAGKSCVLQGLHLGVTLLARLKQKSEELKFKVNNLPIEELFYVPAADYTRLSYKSKLSETKKLSLKINLDDGKEIALSLSRGRNGVFKCDWLNTIKSITFYKDLNASTSIFVPGLAGIPLQESYVSDWYIQKAIARGDANLFLRNILLRVKESGKLDEFHSLLDIVFLNQRVEVSFIEAEDAFINVIVTNEGFSTPLEMVGTGLLQAIQIVAYITMYKPALMILDEPDSHLHPNNQRLLAKLLATLHISTKVQIVIATHSRHLLEAIRAEASSFHSTVWLQNGKTIKSSSPDLIPVLLDLGALSDGEKILNGTYTYVVMTEDSNLEYLRHILAQSGFDISKTFIITYGSSSNLTTVVPSLAELLKSLVPAIKIIVHRDRDYLNDGEQTYLRKKFVNLTTDAELIVTDGPDIESKFCNPAHIAETMGIALDQATEIVNNCIASSTASFGQAWSQKRSGALNEVYRTDAAKPSTGNTPSTFTWQTAPGKELLGLINKNLNTQGLNPIKLRSQSSHLRWENLQKLGPTPITSNSNIPGATPVNAPTNSTESAPPAKG